MTVSLVQSSNPIYNSSTTSLANNALSSTPTSGNLLVYTVWVANTATITPPAGYTTIYTFQSTIRRVGVYAKIASGSEPTQQTFTISTASATWIFANEYNSTSGWATITSGQQSGVYDSTGSVHSLNTSVTSTAGGLIHAVAYTSNSTANNKTITSGYDTLKYSSQLGTSLRATSTWKQASGNDSATLNIVDATNDSRISLVMVEFPVTAGNTVDSIDSTIHVGESFNITTTGLSDLTTASTVAGKNVSAANAIDGDGTLTAAPFVDGQVYPAMGSGVTVIASDGTNTATNSTPTLTTMTGYQYVTIAGLVVNDFNVSKAQVVGDEWVDGDQLHLESDGGTGVLNADTSLENYADGVYDGWRRRSSDGQMQNFTVTISDGNITISYNKNSIAIGFGIGVSI